MKPSPLSTLALMTVLLATLGRSAAATYTVTSTANAGAGSLRDAISQANASAGADTIVFDTAGVFNTDQSIVLGGGQIVISGALTIDAPSAEGRRVTVDGRYGSRIFSVQLTGAGTVTLRHLTLRDGQTTDDGAGIQVDSPAGTTLELVDCNVRYCAARDGGGIDMQDSSLVLTNSFLEYNNASRHGGGVMTHGAVTMTGGKCSANDAGSDGGGIHADGAMISIADSEVRYSDAQRGAGIFAKGGAAVTMTGGDIRYNISIGDGGGVYAAGSSSVTLRGIFIENNEADHGGGIAIRSSTLDATNCVLARNNCDSVGGAIHFRSGTARIKNCTVVANYGGDDGNGIATETGGMSVGNTVIADNPSYGDLDVSGSFLSLGNNFIGQIGLAAGFTNGVDGDIVGTATTLDPKIDIIGGTYAPLAHSRCLENGDSSLVTSPAYGTPPFLDQKGNARIRGVVDIGAIEGTFNAVVSNDLDSGPGSLRDALMSNPTDVSFDPAYFGSTLRTITLTGGQIALSSDLTLVGPTPGLRISGANNSRVFNITSGAVTLRRIRIINGSTTGDGGGIRVINSGTSLALDDAGVSNSTATGRGGGLYMQDNTTVSITNSTFSGDAADGDGGALHVNGGTLNVTNSTISNNTSKQGGGGMFCAAGTVAIINCTLAENTADSDNAAPPGNGGGIRRSAGTVNVGNSIVGKNTDASSSVVHPDVSGVFVSLGHNLIGKTDGLDGASGTPFQNGINGDVAGTVASPVNPQLGALAQVPATNPTRVHPLLSGSAARDAGDPALLTNAAWPSTPVGGDQRGQFRTVGSTVDMGSVEYPDTNIAKISAEDASTSEHTRAPANFRIRRSYDDGTNQVVNIAIHASTTAAGSDYALSGASYTSTGPAAFNVTIPAGKTSVLLTMTPTQDTTAEGLETLALTVSPGAGYATDSGGTNLAAIAIYDDEYTVTSTASSGAGSLREAISNANAGGGGVITMPSGAVVTLAGSELAIASEIEIIGNNSTIDAGGLSRVMVVNNYGGRTVILRNLRLTGGHTDYDGGGLFVNDFTDLEMRGCTIIGNTAASDAGGIAVDYSALLTLTNCSVMDNTAAGVGGGLWAASGDLLFNNVTIGGNRAGTAGGGIYASSMSGDLFNCTITQNISDSSTGFGLGGAGGIHVGTSAVISLGNTVVAGNFDTPDNGGPGTIYPDLAGPGFFVGSQFNFIGSNAGNTFPAGQPTPGNNYVGTAAAPLDPRLVRVNGPKDTYYEFEYGSLLYNHGSNALATTTNDQRGVGRIFGPQADIGAVEMDFLVVNTSLDAPIAGTLRHAISTAAAAGHGTVIFDENFFSVPRTISLFSEFPVLSSLVIWGPAGAQLTISGGTVTRPFRIAPTSPAQVELRNLDIVNGSALSNLAGNRGGGGVLVEGSSTLILTACEIRNCSSATEGGAVNIATGGTLYAADCTFSGNSATLQGGAVNSLGWLSIERSAFSDNLAITDGGGIASTFSGTIANCTFSNNRARNHGGAIYHAGGAADTLALTHCTLTLNRSNNDSSGGGNGGGLRRQSGTVSVRNTIVSGNDALLNAQDDLSGTFSSQGNNLIGTASGSTGFANGVNGDQIGAAAHLGPLQNNGGPTLTHALLAGSAAVDAAAAIPGSSDQRGKERPATLQDVGAYELLPESYAYWAAHTFPSVANAGQNQDLDGDGFSNAFEFGAGSDPLSAVSVPKIVATASGSNVVFDFTASPLAPVRYNVLRYSVNLATWQSAAANLYQASGTDPERNLLLFRIVMPIGTAPRLFARMEHLP